MRNHRDIDQLKNVLSFAIAKRMNQLQISQSDAASSGLIDATRTDLNQIVNGRVSGHSLQKLIVVGRQLGLEFDMTIREPGQMKSFV